MGRRVEGVETEERDRKEQEDRAREQDSGGVSSPFYSESGTPGCCQVTVGRSLD